MLQDNDAREAVDFRRVGGSRTPSLDTSSGNQQLDQGMSHEQDAPSPETATPLARVMSRLKSTDEVVWSSPRELIGWFGHYRRTWRQVRAVNSALRAAGLVTVPDFEGVGFDDPITIRLHEHGTAGPSPNSSAEATTSPIAANDVGQLESPALAPPSNAAADPVHRVARFLPKSVPLSVARDDAIDVAVTHMMANDYSQLPVAQGDRTVYGMVSWRSIGKQRALRCSANHVRECLETHAEVKSDASIFDAIRLIQQHECVLVRGSDGRISGILTAADISGCFEQLSRPFLLLSYIENHLRALIQPRFTVEDLQSAKDPSDHDRLVSDVSDLTFGEYIRLLENPANWGKLTISVERSIFVNQLNEVREIRNDVMHFNPEGIEEKDLGTLKTFNAFLESIVSILSKAGISGS